MSLRRQRPVAKPHRLDPASLGQSALTSAVAERQRVTGADEAAYQLLVADSPPELQALIEQLVVPETWFFRAPACSKRSPNTSNPLVGPAHCARSALHAALAKSRTRSRWR